MGIESFTKNDLDEVFPHPAIREVAFEIRFAPRFRVNAELWKLQDRLVEEYPNPSTESVIAQPGGPVLNVNVFHNPVSGRSIRVSQQNFVIAFTKYTRFEDFKEEAVAKTDDFRSTFGVNTLQGVGLRYVNNIFLPASGGASALLRYVRPLIDTERVDVEFVEQFVNEIRMRHKGHIVTLRGVLTAPLEGGRRVYILDVDCRSTAAQVTDAVPSLLDSYHDTAQRFFLDHITEEYKDVMRGKRGASI